MKILALVPARGGSKRLPGKNVKPLGGKALITWSIDAAKQVSAICDVLVSTDDAAIADVAASAGALVPWMRPAELASDTAKSSDVVLHALDWYEHERGAVDGVLLLQPTSPFRSVATITRGIAEFEKEPTRPVVAVSKTPSHPRLMYSIARDALVPLVSGAEREVRSQDLSEYYVVNGVFYLISPAELRRTRTVFGERPRPLVIDSELEALDIDTAFDWRLAECLLAEMSKS
jgi:CMP-N,N'-diacetyllegionaminic acid synthase